MPGQGSYGNAGKWIHDRAHRIMEEGDTKDEYGKKKGKSVAYALAVQQAHALKKSPKDFRTPHGVHEARQKYDEPKSEYQKTAEGSTWSPTYEDAIRAIILHDLKHGLAGGASKAQQRKEYEQLKKQWTLDVRRTPSGEPFAMMKKAAMTAFFDELEEIEKDAFGLKALGLAAALGTAGMGGAKALPKMVATKAPTAITQAVKRQAAPALMPSAYKRIGTVGGSQTAQLAAEGVGVR